MKCRHICKKEFYIREFKIKGMFGKANYAKGYKKCTHCKISLINAGKYCPCCSTILRTKTRRRKRQQEYVPLLQRLVIDHDLIVVIGYAGSGKTVLASQLGAKKIIDDFDHMTLKSSNYMQLQLKSQVITSRHYGKIVICINRPVSEIIHEQNPCYFILGIHAMDINRISARTGIRKNLLKTIYDKYHRLSRSKRKIKIRPYLFVRGNNYHFGRFKNDGGIP